MSRYPWSVLGIDPTSDPMLIRKAYALRLKVTRPDEDPKGFQALVEARDRALAEAKRLAARKGDPIATESVMISQSDDISKEREEPSDPSQRGVVLLESSSPDGAPRERPGRVIIENSVQTHVVAKEDTDSDRHAFDVALANIGRKHPWESLEFQWRAVFDAVEKAPLAVSQRIFRVVLRRLSHDLSYHRSADGPYRSILIEFEKRFSLLKQDRIFLEHLRREEAEHFVALLEEVVARPKADPVGARTTATNSLFPHLNLRYVEAAFGEGSRIANMYQIAKRGSKFPLRLSVLGLISPILFCLFYRQYSYLIKYLLGLGLVFLVVMSKIEVVVRSPVTSLILALLLVNIVGRFSFLLICNKSRLDYLNNIVAKLRKKNFSEEEIIARVTKWGQPNWKGAIAGMTAMLALVAISIIVG